MCAAFEIQMLSTLAIKCQGGSRIFQFAWQYVSKKTREDLAETFAYYVGSSLSITQHFAKGFDLVFWQLRLLALPKIYCLLMTHLNEWNGRKYFSHWSLCFSFFVCPCYSRRIHYPTLEKPVAQNKAAWVSNTTWVITENQLKFGFYIWKTEDDTKNKKSLRKRK